MLHQLHLGHQISDLDQIILGIAARHHHVGHRRFFLHQECDHVVHVDVVITQRDVDLVEQHHFVALVTDQFFGFEAGRLGQSNLCE